MTKQRLGMRLMIGAIAACAAIPGAFAANCGVDLGTQFRVQLGRQYASNGAIHQTADITNMGSARKGAIYLELYNLPAGVTEAPFTWTSSCEPGAQFIRLYLGYTNTFAAGATKTIMLNFYGAQSSSIVFAYRVLDGSQLPNPRVVPGDYDGDGIADMVNFDRSNNKWTMKKSANGQTSTVVFGAPGFDHFVVGDFDGDLIEDLAIYRPNTGVWQIVRSSDGVAMSVVLGSGTDVPVPADYDGDGYTDLAVYSPTLGKFQVIQSYTGQLATVTMGLPGDIPVPGQYDHDGKADYAIFRPGNATFYIVKSQNNQLFTTSAPGFMGSHPFAADFNGDGVEEPCAYNPSTGKVTIAFAQVTQTVSSTANSLLVVADFSGNFSADLGAYNGSTGGWALDSQPTNPNPHPVLAMTFGTPPFDIPVMTIRSMLW